jgi:hypothetical protein
MNFYATKNIHVVQSTKRGVRSHIHFAGVSVFQDFAVQITKVDIKNFIDNIDIQKSHSSFRIVCLEDSKQEEIDDYGGVEVKVKIGTHKKNKYSNIEYVVAFSRQNFEALQSKLLICVDFELEFEMPEITKAKLREEEEIFICEMNTSLYSYRFLKIKNDVISN